MSCLQCPCHERVQVRVFCFIFSLSSEKLQVWDTLLLLYPSVILAFVLHGLTSPVSLYPIDSNWGSHLPPLRTVAEGVVKWKRCLWSAALGKAASVHTVQSYWCETISVSPPWLATRPMVLPSARGWHWRYLTVSYPRGMLMPNPLW